MNRWLWPRVIPDIETSTVADFLVGIGTILDERLERLSGKLLILGAGYRPTARRVVVQPNWSVGFVRGPLTAQKLGLDADMAFTDPALLVAEWWENSAGSSARIGFVPHFRTSQVIDCRKACERSGLVFIDPTWPTETVLKTICGMDRVIAEAMHGAIVADALGIPWLRIKALSWRFETNAVSEFKWADWAGSMEIQSQAAFDANLSCYLGKGSRVMNRLQAGRRAAVLSSVLQAASAAKGFQLSRLQKRKELCRIMTERIQTMVGR
ncbi:MAG: polysaccharide pyruvyl transferase family protein [Desulfobacterales bacterium]